jgi:hypothetical protein
MIDKPFAKQKREMMKINKIKEEKGNITTNIK